MKKIIFAVLFFVCLSWSGSVFSNWTNSIFDSCGPDPGSTLLSQCAAAYPSQPWRIASFPMSCGGGSLQTRHRCQYWNDPGNSPCSELEIWNQDLQQCGDPPTDCTEKEGQDAGIIENSPTPPGYELQCFGECAVEAAEFFQRTDNDNWVIAYRYTGQLCGPGDPLGEPDVPPGEEGPPAVQPNTPPDTDNDGIPDSNDSDIDGDGLPNSEDEDTDGDGNPDINDPSPGGPGEQEPASSAHVGLNCAQSPSCSGDAIQCAQLVELHRLRCAGSLDASDITDMVNDLDGLGDSMLQDAVDAQIEGIEDGLTEFDDVADGPVSLFGEMIKGFLPQPVSCSAYVVAFPWPVGTQSFSCEKFDLFKLIYGWFLSVLVLIYVWHMAVQPVNK